MFVAPHALASPNSMSSQSGLTLGEARFPVSAGGAARKLWEQTRWVRCRIALVHGHLVYGNPPDVRA